MNYSDFLTTIAQVCGILVGFANLAIGFDRSRFNTAEWGQIKARILILTETGVLMIGCCCLPFVLFFFTRNETNSFKIASAIASLTTIVNTFFNARRYRTLGGEFNFVAKAILLSALVLGGLLLLANATFEFPPDFVIAVYCFSLLSIFMMLCVVFIRLFRAMVK